MQDQTDAAGEAAPRPTVTFRELGLPEPLLRAVADLGFERCTPIQQEVLPYTLLGHDCIGKAQTGTGKTAAFLLTIMPTCCAIRRMSRATSASRVRW